jgi:hypothetical protein
MQLRKIKKLGKAEERVISQPRRGLLKSDRLQKENQKDLQENHKQKGQTSRESQTSKDAKSDADLTHQVQAQVPAHPQAAAHHQVDPADLVVVMKSTSSRSTTQMSREMATIHGDVLTTGDK